MEKSSSCRETMEHPVSSSHLNMLRSTSLIATQTDATNFFQCLRFDPKVVAADHKSIRQGDFKSHVNIALGIQGDESPLKGKSEGIKRLKAGLRENNVKARECVKIFSEASSVSNKFFPSLHTKKRSQPDTIKLTNHNAAHGEDRSLVGLDGWEMKKKRSGIPKPRGDSLVPHKTPSPSDWDISGCSNKPPLLSVTQWASQQPQKISRVRRRKNLVPIVSSNDDVPSADVSDLDGNETGFGSRRHSPAASPQMESKRENGFSTTALLVSDEFSPPEIKTEDKGKQSDEVDIETSPNVPKVSIPGLQSRKNKLVGREEFGDGVRRKKRTGRGSASTRSVKPVPLKKRGTARQLPSARNSSDESESKAARPPTRKLSGPKACKPQKKTRTNARTLDFPVGLDDGQEELLAAANSAINFAQNFPSSFWKQMEPYFCFLSDAHLNILKQQVELSSVCTKPVGTSLDLDSPEELVTSKVDSKATPLYQKLLSALIPEDSTSENEDSQFHESGADAVSETRVEFSGDTSEKLDFDELENDVCVNSLAHHVNGRFSDLLSINFSDIQYETLGIDEKIYIEAQSIGICLEEPMPSIPSMEDEEFVDNIKTLEETICELGSKKKEVFNQLLKSALEMKELQKKEIDQLGYDTLIEITYEKSKVMDKKKEKSKVRGKSLGTKISKQAAYAFIKRTLERCRQFEETGNSCFTFKDTLIAGLTQSMENHANSPENGLREGKDDMKERELLLDDVGGQPISSSTKGKRSERDRDGKGQASSSDKIGQSAISNAMGERKSKTKPIQKTTPMLSSSPVNIVEPTRTSISKPTNSNNGVETLDGSEEPLDFSNLQIPDGLLDGPNYFDTQPGDLSSWLNMADDSLPDTDDLLGLQTPMDDLSDLKVVT